MNTKLIKSLALGVALSGLASAALADTEVYGINVGSGWEGVGYANGGQLFAQIASVPNAAGWQSRFNSGNLITHEFSVQVYASDAPSVYDWIAAHLNTPNYTTSGSVAAFDVTKNTGNVLAYTGGYFGSLGFPSLTAGATGSTYLAADIITASTAPASSAGVRSAIPASAKLGWSTGYANATVAGCSTAGVVAVGGITITDLPYQNSFFGLSKDCSDLVLTLPTADLSGYASWLAEANSPLDKRSGSVTYYDVNGHSIGTLNLTGLTIRGINLDHLYDGPTYGNKVVWMTVDSASFTR
jgi:hypothetical protein